MAAVYAAKHRNGRNVALKMLHPELSIRAEIRKRFLREGHAANSVKHPGAVVVIDDDVAEDGSAFLVMELLAGESVEELWQRNGGRLPPKVVLAIGRELCEILAAAHDAGIVHRDIKPANLFVTAAGQLKVLDFGLARLRDATAASNATATGLVFGTPAFMPPEQASGRTSQIGAQTDIWAIGATLFTLASGRTVHEGESAQHLTMLAATTRPRSLASALPRADAALVRVVDRALAFKKQARWIDCRAMRTAICEASEILFNDAAPTLREMTETIWPLREIATRAGAELIGTKTSQPVASSAPTTPRERRGVARPLMTALRMATAIPMSSTAWARRAGLAVVAGVAIAGIVTITSMLAVYTFQRAPRTEQSRSERAPAVSVRIPVEVDRTSAGIANQSESAPSGPIESASASAQPSGSGASGPGSARAFVRRPVPASKCTPPFVVNADGKRLWKSECL